MDGTHILVFTLKEISGLSTTGGFVKLFKEKLCQLVAQGTLV
jgi:hypothetical protein